MYGKKRIVINKKGQILLKGGKGNFGIGLIMISLKTTKLVAKFLKPGNKFDNEFTDENSIELVMGSIKELRSEISNIYNISK